MSIDSMRVGGGRCPPLLVGGLVIACIMMICNWWTLSSTNLELLRQIDELNEQIKISVEERDQCVTQKGILEIKFKSCEDDARITHVKLSQASETLLTCNQELKSYKHLDVTRNADLEALRIDKETITKQLDNQQKENKKLKEELKKMKDDMENLKLSMNAPVKKQTSMMPIVRLLEKSHSDNKTANVPNSQVNAPPNIVNNELQTQDFQEKDNSNLREDNAAEVNDANNAIDTDLNINLMPDAKMHENKK